MRLYSLTFNGFKRFKDSWINLDGRTVAIVGPNEAGKTSVLDALVLLNDDSPVPAKSITRGESFNKNAELLSARFRLSQAERAQAPLPLRASEGIWLIVGKTLGGARQYRLDPPARRDRSARQDLAETIRASLKDPWFVSWAAERTAADAGESDAESDDDTELSPKWFYELLPQLGDKLATLPSDSLELARRLHSQLVAATNAGTLPRGSRTRARRLVKDLATFERLESVPHPNELATMLKDQVPTFLAFNTAQRELASEYDLADEPQRSSLPLRNLAAMAELSLDALLDAIQTQATGAIRTLQERAQHKLNSKLLDAWKQAPLTVSFDRNDTVLGITVSSHEDEYFSLDERSAGMRIFLALRAFLSRHQYPVQPILLVDEAETHLHYDAQADLTRVFEQQDVVAAVIYTTHSIGCLPEDLGRGVRVITPIPNSTRSSIENVWGRDGAGARPLILAMGAATVPLAPSRYVAIGEGPSDPMLMPSMLRQATGKTSLEFQVVGGLSEASDIELKRLDLEAPRVAYLVDGDDAGVELRSRLRGLGIRASKIVMLSSPGQALCLEDYIDPDLYAEAINQYLKSWPPHPPAVFSKTALGASRRPRAVAAWCVSHGAKPPGKVNIAQEVLRLLEEAMPSDRSLVDRSKVGRLRLLDKRLRRALGIGADT